MSQLTREQRYTISEMYKQGFSRKSIADTIGKDKSVVSREIKRNSDEKGRYRFSYAHEQAELRKERLSKPRRFTGEVQNRIERYMRQFQWSPEQIVGYCKLNRYSMVSVSRIYQYIRQDKESDGDLWKHCRFRLKHRKRPVGKHLPIRDRVSIEERPSEADGTRFGDWEMDLIVGPGNKDAMLTLTERSLNYSIITKLPKGKDSDGVAEAAYRELLPFLGNIRSITTDNGTEFAKHKWLAKALQTTIYFAHPYCSWEKGLIEYTNRLFRQYLPKGMRFNKFTEEQIKQIQYKINARPRKKLGFLAPVQLFFRNLTA